MHKLSITHAHFIDGGDDAAADARKRYKEDFPGRSARRMSHLGMLVTLCIRNVNISQATPVIYASAFAESKSLEDFIDSFPTASPSLFQTSIHPSAVEQGLIPQKQPIDRFYPITAKTNLAGLSLENALLLADSHGVSIVGGEERGSWLCPYGLASDQAFAFGLSLSPTEEGIGTLNIEPAESIEMRDAPSLIEFAHAIRDRKSIEMPSIALKSWIRLQWK